MNYVPFTTCMKPLRIFNRNTKQFDYVSCRHCESCTNQYASSWSMRVGEECKQHRYSYFFTLTYDNEWLPTISVFQDRNNNFQLQADGRLNSMIPSLPYRPFFNPVKGYDEFDGILPNIQHSKSTSVAVLSKQDIILFLKRLRKNIFTNFKTLTNEQRAIRYFVAGEYGPATQRPHYHGILWYDNEKIHSQILRLIKQSWGLQRRESGSRNRFSFQPFCHDDRFRDIGLLPTCGLVNSSAPQYVSKYVSGNSDIPQILSYKQFKPFHISSKGPTIGNFKDRKKEIFEHYQQWWCTPIAQRDPRDVIEHVSHSFNEQMQCLESCSLPYSQNTLDTLWCKCYEYRELSDYQKYLTYSFVRRHRFDYEERRELDGLTGFQRLKLRYPQEWNYLSMDKPVNQLASKKAYKACNILGCSVEHYLDIYSFYLKEKQLYKLRNFYLSQQQFINDYPDSSLFPAYPFAFEDLPHFADVHTFSRIHCVDPCTREHFSIYRNPALNLAVSLGYKVSQFYPDYCERDEKFIESLLLSKQSYYKAWETLQAERSFKSNKTKKKNNSYSEFRTLD